ncbi:hypothetical protein [Microbacterium sp. CPCC 204701]|uniref:hypothetical protein n=1 Tax=Microbacterium sp. CPCC 204701 TaxID=2493084 RepID=UPI000FD9E10A|nr:hypothetical protein [Microbacterium sp. CPCC 204701]
MNRPNDTRRRRGLRWGRPFEVFAEAMFMGFLAIALALPLVTLVAAIHASVRHLRRAMDDERPGVRDYVDAFRECVLHSWRLSLALGTLLTVGVVIDLPLLAREASTPSVAVVGIIIALAWLSALITTVRMSAQWRPGDHWNDLGELVVLSSLHPRAIIVAGTALVATVMVGILLPVGLSLFGVTLLAAALEVRSAPRPAELPPTATTNGETRA